LVRLEGLVDAMVLVEGRKRAGRDLTREEPINAIESIHSTNVDMGPKLVLDYAPNDHKGFDDVHATMVQSGQASLADGQQSASQSRNC